MLTPPLFGSPFRHVRRCVLTASILPAALATQAWAQDWNGPVTINIDPVVGVGLIEGKSDLSAFDLTSPNFGDGPGRDGQAPGLSLSIFMGQETANFAEGTTADFDNFWNDNRTWIYTGEINSGPSGMLSFAESIDDSTQIKIDDVVVLQDQVWNVPTATGVLQFTPNTYHTIEVRMGNGLGGAGPVSVNNFVANVPTDPPTANGYGFGFSQTGATGTNGANYIKPIDPGDGTLFRHEVTPATAAGQDITVSGSSTVTLQKTTSDHITENSITFTQPGNAVTLTVKGDLTPGGTLRSLGTVLASHSGTPASPPTVPVAIPNVITINGDADFAPGALSTGPNPGEASLTLVELRKNGGAGQLILDNPTNALAGTTLKVIDGTLSIIGGGGTSNPVSSLTTGIEIGGTTAGLAPVLRLGGGTIGTNFVNKIFTKQNGTLVHASPATDSITAFVGGAVGPTLGIDASRTLTVNVSGGGLIVNGYVTRSTSTAQVGGTLVKKGLNTTLRINGIGTETFLTGVNADEGRLEIANRLRGPTGTNPVAITIGANGTLALLNADPGAGHNVLPATLTVSAGTLEGVPGAFTTGTGATPSPSTLQLTGGAVTLGPGFGSSLIANLYTGNDAGANAAFNSYANYLSYFAGRGPGTVTTTNAYGYADLAFGLPIAQTGAGPAMFAPIAPTFVQTDNIVSRMHGKINISTAGLYTFGAGSDDGSMIYIDGKTVVANNLYQGHTRRTGSIELTAGLHDIDVGFYEGGGFNSLVVDWAGPGINGTQTIPNTVLLPVAPDMEIANNFSNPVVIPASSTSATINASLASVPSVSLSVGKTLTVNGNLFNTGVLTLSGGAGTYTFNTNTIFGEVVVPSIVDSNAAVAIVKNGPGTLVLDAGANPQLQSATSITATAGALGLVIGGPISPTGSAAINVNGAGLVLSSKGGDQSYALPNFTSGGSITARKIGSGVAGTSATPILMTVTGNLALNSGTTLNLGSANDYILAMPGGISGNATVNINGGTVETTGAVNVGGPLNVNPGSRLNVNGGTVTGGPIVVNTAATLSLGVDDALGSFANSPSSLTVNGGNVTAVMDTHSTLPAVTLNGGTLGATGPGNAPAGLQINYILDRNVTTVPSAAPSTINAPAILLRGDPLNTGTNGPVTFTVPRGTGEADLVVSSVIYDGGAGLIKNGDGILNLSGENAYTGPIVINAGTVVANGSSSLGASAVRLNSGTVLAVGAPPTFAGFGNMSLNGGATVTDDILTLTTDVGNQSRSAFTQSRYSVGDGFSASFVYQATGAAGPGGLADGITFTVQNSAPNIVGGGGGGLGYTGIGNSAALELNVYLGAGFPIGTAFHTNGGIQGYISSAPVNLAGGNPIQFDVVYNSTALTFTENLMDLVTGATYTNTFTVPDLSSILGGGLAYVGFTGATGGAQAFQTVESFVFNDFAGQQNVTLSNDITVSAGATVGIDVPSVGPGAGGTATLEGILTLNAGSILNVTGGTTATDTPFLLDVTGETLLTGNSTVDVANNGTGEGTLQLGEVSGSAFSLTKIGEGTLALGGPVDVAVLNANEGTTEINVSQTLTALHIGADGVVVLGGSTAPAPLAFDAETAEATAQAVPEPGSAMLFLSGLSALLARRRPRRSLPSQR